MKKNFCISMIIALGASAAQGAVVINEIFYDGAGTDTGEYIELYNNGSSPVDISGYQIILVNGSSSTGVAYGPSPITVPAATSLAAGDYYVVGNKATIDAVYGASPSVVDQDINLDNVLQNGAPDAVVLRDASSARLDSLNYEADAVFGPPVPPLDTTQAIAEGGTGRVVSRLLADISTNVTLGRLPNGVDTDSNLLDFAIVKASPGAANAGSGTLPVTDSFSTSIDPAWTFSFVAPRSVNPTDPGKPGVPSPDGGNVMEVFDATGGGDTSMITGANPQINFTGFLWIPPDSVIAAFATGVAVGTRNDAGWFSATNGNGLENGFYLEYQAGGGAGVVEEDGKIAAHPGTAKFLAIDPTGAINFDASGTSVTELGVTNGVNKGAWNAFQLVFDRVGNRVAATINGINLYDGVFPAGVYPASGGVTVGFREGSGAAFATPGEGTWIDGVVVDTNVSSSVNEWSIY